MKFTEGEKTLLKKKIELLDKTVGIDNVPLERLKEFLESIDDDLAFREEFDDYWGRSEIYLDGWMIKFEYTHCGYGRGCFPTTDTYEYESNIFKTWRWNVERQHRKE